MIALDTNVLVRYLVNDDAEQANAARVLLESLTAEEPGFVCREVMVELVWVLQRAYGFARGRIAMVSRSKRSMMSCTPPFAIRAAMPISPIP